SRPMAARALEREHQVEQRLRRHPQLSGRRGHRSRWSLTCPHASIEVPRAGDHEAPQDSCGRHPRTSGDVERAQAPGTRTSVRESSLPHVEPVRTSTRLSLVTRTSPRGPATVVTLMAPGTAASSPPFRTESSPAPSVPSQGRIGSLADGWPSTAYVVASIHVTSWIVVSDCASRTGVANAIGSPLFDRTIPVRESCTSEPLRSLVTTNSREASGATLT